MRAISVPEKKAESANKNVNTIYTQGSISRKVKNSMNELYRKMCFVKVYFKPKTSNWSPRSFCSSSIKR